MKKNEGSFASEVTVNLATGMEPSWCETFWFGIAQSSGSANYERA